MTKDEWKSLEVGSIVSNKHGKNVRAVISVHKQSNSITLPSNRDKAKLGYTVYISGDKKNFRLIGKLRKK